LNPSQNKDWDNDLPEHNCDQDYLIIMHASLSLSPFFVYLNL
jgi:hypothetical protein